MKKKVIGLILRSHAIDNISVEITCRKLNLLAFLRRKNQNYSKSMLEEQRDIKRLSLNNLI